MVWTTPRTWTVGELVTESMLNTHIRDNLADLDARAVTALGTFRNMRLRTHQDSDKAASKVILVSAREIVMDDGRSLANWSLQTADISMSGLNGLDTGSE